MEFKPTIKQYIALMKLWCVPRCIIEDWKRVNVLDDDWEQVFDTDVTDLWYWGAAWGWKSLLISYWLKTMCERYPWTRRFLARKELKRLKASTLLTFFEVLAKDWYEVDKDYSYKEIKWVVEFKNGSTIHLLELWYQPSDPLYSRLWSSEYSGWAIDEANEIDFDWYELINTRIRYKLEDFCHRCAWKISRDDFLRTDLIQDPDFWTDPDIEYTEDDRYMEKNIYKCTTCGHETWGLPPRMISSFNPDKGWVNQHYYRPFRDKVLPSNRAFIPALPWDNPYLSKAYINKLKKLKSEVTKQRLLYGNFDYDDSPGRLFNYVTLLNWFKKKTSTQELKEKAEEDKMYWLLVKTMWECLTTWYNRYIVIDPARAWRDLATITIWNNFSIEKIIIYWTSDMEELRKKIELEMYRYNIDKSHVLVDEWWVWGGLKDILWCRWFLAHNSALVEKEKKRGRTNELKSESYYRLRDQCYWHLSLNQDNIAISLDNVEIIKSDITVNKIQTMIIDETDIVCQIDLDKDGPFRVMTKEQIKKNLKRSPDLWDNIMMRMFFEIKKPKRVFTRKN